MELILKRISKQKSYTIGKLYVKTNPQTPPEMEGGEAGAEIASGNESLPTGEDLEGSSYFCDTLEPTWRDYAHGAYKIKGKSAIPEGRYAVVISYSPRFQAWLPLLLGGPEFNRKWQGIRIHAGNSAQDTAGCILVGENRETGRVLDSRLWLHRLKQKIMEARARGEAVWLTVM